LGYSQLHRIRESAASRNQKLPSTIPTITFYKIVYRNNLSLILQKVTKFKKNTFFVCSGQDPLNWILDLRPLNILSERTEGTKG
jgi:hypothetical protein